MYPKGRDKPSRDRKGAVFVCEIRPLPHGRGSEKGFSKTLSKGPWGGDKTTNHTTRLASAGIRTRRLKDSTMFHVKRFARRIPRPPGTTDLRRKASAASVTESAGIGDSCLAGGRGSCRATAVMACERHGSPGGSPSQGLRRKCHRSASARQYASCVEGRCVGAGTGFQACST